MNDNGELEFDETHELNSQEMDVLLSWAERTFKNGGILLTRKEE